MLVKGGPGAMGSITPPVPQIFSGLVEPPLKLGHGGVLTSHVHPSVLLLVHILILVKPHSADSSIKLSGRHTTQTRQVRWSELHASVVIEWSPACLHKRHKKTSNGRRSQLTQCWSYKRHLNFKPTWIFLKIFYVSFRWYFWQKYKNLDVGTGTQQQRQGVY